MLAVVVENGVVREADLLGIFPAPGTKKSSPTAARKVLSQLVKLGLLVRHAGQHSLADDLDGKVPSLHRLVIPDEARPVQGYLRAPETVHWAVTYNCHFHCPDCYARRHRKRAGGEMNTAEAQEAVAALADWGVFQLAIGGGEPFLRPDLPDLASAAAQLGMVVHVTTGEAELPGKVVERLSPSVKVLQFSINEHRLVEEPQKEMDRLRHGLQMAAGAGMKTGANLKVSKTTLANFKSILDRLAECGFNSITLLRYKPPPTYERWLAENPSSHSLPAFELFLAEATTDFPQLTFRVDCALSFLFRHLEAPTARAQGVRGCAAAQRIAALDPQGNLLPCSQLSAPRFRAGNILTEEPALIWRESPVFKRYRFFRDKASFKQSQCGICKANAHCGGCRAFANDALGADPFCPGPLWPPLKSLGRHGRKVELAKYISKEGCISVGEYMERYGVGQKTAVKELRNSFLEKADPEARGHKKADCYSKYDDDLVGFIQDSIGYTSGGLPFVTAEEISSWLIEEDPGLKYRGYPRWLVNEGALESEEDKR